MKRTSLTHLKRIVVKIGTSSLILPNGDVNLPSIEQLAETLSNLQAQGYQIILVSSGAIGVGMQQLGLLERPKSIAKQQAVAAIGQSELIKLYNHAFSKYSQQTAQVLLTRDVVDFPESGKNVINTFEELLSMGVIPIVNENDSVSVDELDHLTKFGDNDQLSAIVANLSRSECLIMLSDIDGFFNDNPHHNPDAVLYEHISEITPELEAVANGKGSKFGTGGMTSKLKAAHRMLANDSQMVLANGKEPRIIKQILQGDPVGTLFSNKI